MKAGKGETKQMGTIVKVELEMEKTVADQLETMSSYTKIPKAELVTTALKRFISAHKDYFPES